MSNNNRPAFQSLCPIPIRDYPQVLLAHGGGGRLTHELISKMFMPAFANPILGKAHDSSVLDFRHQQGPQLAFTTDSFVVKPLFFPGGNIGKLAVYGTVNDLAMSGAKPLYLSAAAIIEEGLPMETLWQVVQEMQAAAQIAHVSIVTGDTKVVDKGKGDGIFLNTSGIGIVESPEPIQPQSVQPGDLVLINGDIGRHGIVIMAMRENLALQTNLESDCAPLAELVLSLVHAGIHIHCLRDLTRGGLASALVEIAESSHLHIQIQEAPIPIREEVKGACEILGFDPLYVANEGKLVCFVPEAEAAKALEIMRCHASGAKAVIIGTVIKPSSAFPQDMVTMKSRIGAYRVVDMLSGEQLPRIC